MMFRPVRDFKRAPTFILPLFLVMLALPTVEAQTRQRRNFYGMHNLMDGGAPIPEGMNWTRHMVGEGGYVFDWVRGDYGKWVVDAMDRGLIPCLRVQNCNGGCDPSDSHPEVVATIIREHLEQYRPDYLNRLIYFQIWNEPGDPRDRVTPERYANHLVAAYAGVKRADKHGVFRVMTPGQNGPSFWETAIRHNPAVCQAFDVWATHPYPESYPPHYNHHDGVPFINQVKTIDSYLLDLDTVGRVCDEMGSSRRGFPVMITETAYGDHLGISYEGYPKTTRGAPCLPGGPCEYEMAAQYNVAAFAQFWHQWPEVLAVHPFILNNWAWDHFAFVSKTSGSRDGLPVPSWCPAEDPLAATAWPPGYSTGARRCGLPDAPYPQYNALLETPKPVPSPLEPYRGPVGAIRGTVRRTDTGEPVKYATVFTDGRELGGPSLYDGQFAVRAVPVGTYTLSVEKVGYLPASTMVTVRDGEESIVDFELVYQGKVSKGIYFQNRGTCSGCNLFAPFLGQTFVTPPDVGFIKFVAAMPNVGDVTMKFSILDGGPTGPRVGDSVTAYLEWGGEMIGAELPGDGIPVEPNHTYFLKVERTDGEAVYLYATDANPYSDGMAYTGTTPHSSWDLFATIRGNTVAVDSVVGSIAGVVEDPSGTPVSGATVDATPGDHTAVTDSGGSYVLSALAPGTYTLRVTANGYETHEQAGVVVNGGDTTIVDVTLTPLIPPLPPVNLVANGDFSQGLAGWSLWVERGSIAPTVNPAGQLQLAATGFNGGMYQQFSTGGADREISIEGFWASRPTAPNGQWAEILVINGPRAPVNGQDINEGSSDVILIYKNDTWASPAGWSGITSQTSPVRSVGSFVASGNVATLILKSGNLPAVQSGTVFDDIVVRGPDAPPLPSNRAPTAVATANPSSGTAPLEVQFNGAGSSDPDGDILSYVWDFGDGSAAASVSAPSHTYASAGDFNVSLTVDDGKGRTDSAALSIHVDPTPSTANLIVNGDFSQGLSGWSVWTERGSPSLTVRADGRAWVSGTGYNGGIYQQFATGGEGSEIAITGFWASEPTVPNSQWAEVLIIDGPRLPVNGQDIHAGQSDVILIYKNDSWATPGGWSGEMDSTALVANLGSFVATGEIATIILKSGNLQGVRTGAIFDDIVAAGGTAPPPPPPVNQPPQAVATASPPSGSPPLMVRFDGSGSSDPDGDTLSYSWEFGDGGQGSGMTASHTYQNAGDYTATLRVDDGKGGTDTVSLTIPVSPDSTPSGPNLVANGGFEGGFTDGLASGWTRWSTSGTGYWKPSSRLGRIGAGVYSSGGQSFLDTIVRLNPKVVLVFDQALGMAPAIRAALPDALIIGRLYVDHLIGQYLSDPERWGRHHAEECYRLHQEKGGVFDAWQGLNEPFMNSVEDAGKAARFEKAFSDRLQELGLKSVVFNLAVGNPGDMDNMLLPEVVDALATADYVGYHAYGGDSDQLMVGPQSPWFAHRWRFYANMYEERGYRMPPVVYTEATTFHGWKGVFAPSQIRDDLIAFEQESRTDPWAVGLAIFTFGLSSGDWVGWEVSSEPVIYEGAGDHNWLHPADAKLGAHSQQFGTEGGGFTGGMVQRLSVEPGASYRFTTSMKYRTYLPGTRVSYRVGIDRTGQIRDGNASTISWSSDLIGVESRETDMWYTSSELFTTTGDTVSIWLAGAGIDPEPFRLSVDEVTVEKFGGDPPPQDLPDVAVESVTLSPATPLPGQAVTFTALVRNVGPASTPDGVVIGVGYFIDGEYVTWGTVPGPVAPGASVTVPTTGGTWTASAGEHTLTALVDDINRFEESNEDNNSRSASFAVGGASLPDVVVDSVAVSPSSPHPGGSVTFTAVVRNAGSVSTPSGVAIGVGYFIDGGYVTWGTVPGPLAPGASVTVPTTGGSWTASPGEHTLTALVDDINRFQESNEDNNSRSLSFAVGGFTPSGENLYGMNIDPANPAGNPSARQLQDIGVRWVRIEWKAPLGYGFYDSIISNHRAAGLKVLLLVDYSSVPGKPASNAGDADWTSYLSSFESGVRGIAAHYRDGVDAWQIWNEPDLFHPGTGYDPGVPARHFGNMLRQSVDAIRPYSSRPIITGGLASGDPGYLVSARDAAGGLTVNAVAVHPYGQRAPDNWPHPSWGFGNMSDLFNRYLVFGLPLWVTEIGTIDEAIQAAYLENVYELARDAYPGRVHTVLWFCWSDGMVSPFGIVTASGEPKPAYHQYRAVAPPW